MVKPVLNTVADLSQMFFKKGVLKNFAKTPMLESLVNKVAGLKAWNFNKKRFQHRCFPMAASRNVKTFHLSKCFVIN